MATGTITYSTSNFRPLRIRARLQTGVISDQFLPLDAILYYHAVRDAYGEQDVTIPGASTIPEGGDVSLPLLKCEGPESRMWFYGCSFAQWPAHTVEDKTFYVKQARLHYSDMIGFQGRRGKIQNRRGPYKSYHVNVYYRHALHVDWYCVGDPAALRGLLRFCTNIGKKGSQGWGAVLDWEVTEWPEDWSIKDGSGRRVRAIPSSQGRGFLYGIRPSYWHRRHQFPCAMPDGA